MTAWRRAPAFVGLVALALLHISAAAHQFQHAADHDLGVCQACSAYNNLEDSAVSHPPSIEIPLFADAVDSANPALPRRAPTALAYQPRAPPRS